MADTLGLVFYGAWNDPNWIDISDPIGHPGTIPAGTGNDLNVDLSTGGTMTGNVSANAITVPTALLTPIVFNGGTIETSFFELSASQTAGSLPLTLSGADLTSTATLIVGQTTTLDVTAGSSVNGPSTPSPGLQDFGDIEVNNGTVTSNGMNIYATLDLVSSTGTFATLSVGSYTGPGGFGGVGQVTIDSASSIDVISILGVAPQTGTGTIVVNGGTLTVNGDAQVGYAGTAAISVTAGGSLGISGTLDLAATNTATANVLVAGTGSDVSVTDETVIGDAGTGIATISGGSLAFGGTLIVGDTGSGTLTVSQGAVGSAGQGTIEIGASDGGSGVIMIAGSGASLNGGVLDVGGKPSGSGGNGLLSIGLGGTVALSTATIWDSGAVVLSGGNLTASPIQVNGAVSGYGTLGGNVTDTGTVTVNSGVLTITGAFAGGGALGFQGGATLVLGAPGTTGVVESLTGLYNGDRIELAGLTIQSAAVTSPGTISVVTTGNPFVFNNVAFAAGSSQTILTGHDNVTGDDYLQVACFLRGTKIATPTGERPVEQLSPGDMVATRTGEARRIVWIGKGAVLATPSHRTAATPVLIRKNAFADNIPNADLRVTKAHGFHFDDILIPAEFLVNNRSILWDDRAREVEIYHIELETHDVILANGAPAETYRDDGNRWLFRNANTGWGLPPLAPCAPVVTGGPAVDAIWQRLLRRAGPRPGMPLTDDPDLHLLVDGIRLDPAEAAGPHRTFFVPGQPARIEIASRDAVPLELGIARDPRALGVALRSIEIHRGAVRAAVRPEDPRLTDGFHAYEPDGDLRWTNGRAALPAECLALPGRGPRKIVLTLAGATQYPDCGVAARAA